MLFCYKKMFQAPLSPYNRTRSKKCSLSYGVSRKLACRKPLRRAWTSGASCQPRLWVGSILVLSFPPKTKAIAVPRHSPSMKRSQKYLWRPSGLDLPGERMKDSNRPEGILELAEGPDTHLWSPVFRELDERLESGELQNWEWIATGVTSGHVRLAFLLVTR